MRLIGQVAQNPGHLQVEMILEADDLPHGIGVAEQLACRRLGEEDGKRLGKRRLAASPATKGRVKTFRTSGSAKRKASS